jgi:tetratricopeptide (TPR) repeat protein/predicted Ser/Thr protein kinase
VSAENPASSADANAVTALTPTPARGTDREMIEAALRAVSPRSPAMGPAMPDEDALPPPDSIPGYDILREIHRGGQGVVYQAIQRATKRKVAVKVMHEGPFAGSRGRARFEREVEILAQLEHPNIVSVIDSGSSAGSSYYVMDYISGQPLDAWLASAGKEGRSIDETLRMFTKICDAVNAAHLKGITHRDLKPSNIRIDANGEPHVLDFGLAKVLIGEVTAESKGGGADHMQMVSVTGQFIGSLPWASPEQAEGVPGKIDIRSDVYSLGVVLYQMLTGGKFPYTVVGNMRDVMDNILKAEPAKPSTIRRQINDEVETIVLKALSKERERRYQSAGELARDVRHYLQGEPIEAMRDSGWYLLRKTMRRYKFHVGVAAGFLVLLTAFGIVSFALYMWAAAEAAAATKALTERNEALRAEIAARNAETLVRTKFEHATDAGRALAHEMIFPFHDRIENLRGATAARELLVTRANEYVKAFEQEFGEDPKFLEELADTWDRLGVIQTGLYLPKVGTWMAGQASFERALAIRQRLFQFQPEDPRVNSALGRSLFRSAQVKHMARDFNGALAEVQKALEYFDRAIARADARGMTAEDRRQFEEGRNEAIMLVGDEQVRLAVDELDPEKAAALIDQGRARFTEAAASWERRLQADPGDVDAARFLETCRHKMALPHILLGSALLRKGEKLVEDNSPDAPATLEAAIAEFAKAQPISEASLQRLTTLSAANPAEGRFRRDMFLAEHNVGTAIMLSAQALDQFARMPEHEGRKAQALALHQQARTHFEAALAITRELANADQANLEAQRDVAICLNKLGNEFTSIGKAGEKDPDLLKRAEDTYRESLTIRQSLYKTDKTQMHRRDVAVGLAKVADVRRQRGDFDDAVRLYDESLVELRGLVADGVMKESGPDITEVTKDRDAARDKKTD